MKLSNFQKKNAGKPVQKLSPELPKLWRCSGVLKMATNAPTLGEGGDFNHKCRCGERMLNIAVNVERSTAPPLLPNVCYALVAII
jgi:hypothetical protein